MNLRGRILIPIALLTAVGVISYFLSKSDVEGPVMDESCKQDSDCGPDESCCNSACNAGGPCSEAELPRSVQAPKRQTPVKDRNEIEALREGGGLLPSRPRKEKQNKRLEEGKCEAESDCPSLQTCEFSTGSCAEPAVCLDDQDCKKGRKCHYGECVDKIDGCRLADCMPTGTCNYKYKVCEKYVCKNDADCAGPRRCDPETLNCTPCLEDGDCPGAKKCQPGLFCMAADGCAGDGDCPDGLCNISKAQCQSARCQDDDLEENDKWTSATPLEEDTTLELVACPEDKDWFKIELNEGEGFVINLKFNPLPGMLEAVLKDVNGLEVRRAGDSGDQGSIKMVWPRAEEKTIYYVGIKHRSGVEVPYKLTFAFWPDGFCQNDQYEPNDESDVATSLAAGTHWNLRLCEGDDDWIIHTTPKGEKTKILVQSLKGAPVRLEVFRGEEEKPFLVDDSREVDKMLQFTSQSAGDYFVRVSPLLFSAETLYHVKID